MKGKTVAILESRMSTQLAELVGRHGARPLPAPALAEIPDVDPGRIAALVRGLQARPARLFVFQTGVGTQALFRTTDDLGVTGALMEILAASLVAVRGPKPTAALRQRKVRIDRSAAEPYTTAQTLAATADVDLGGQRVIVQRYGAHNAELDQALAARGAEVLEIPVYRWALPADTAPLVRLLEALEGGAVDATVFTSASQVHNLFEMARRRGTQERLAPDLHRSCVASIGPVCSAALRAHGVQPSLEASPPKLGPLIAALEAALS